MQSAARTAAAETVTVLNYAAVMFARAVALARKRMIKREQPQIYSRGLIPNLQQNWAMHRDISWLPKRGCPPVRRPRLR